MLDEQISVVEVVMINAGRAMVGFDGCEEIERREGMQMGFLVVKDRGVSGDREGYSGFEEGGGGKVEKEM